jgi:hypothetical protein
VAGGEARVLEGLGNFNLNILLYSNKVVIGLFCCCKIRFHLNQNTLSSSDLQVRFYFPLLCLTCSAQLARMIDTSDSNLKSHTRVRVRNMVHPSPLQDQIRSSGPTQTVRSGPLRCGQDTI